jgi:hypothetical protein
MTCAELNEEYRRFWANQADLLRQRITNDIVRQIALDFLREQELMEVPMRSRWSLEKALENAETSGKRFAAEWSRKGGKANKSDALQLLIEDIVKQRPATSARELEDELRRRERVEPIDEIADGQISFTDNGHLKDAPLSGLKDRLSRAKKKLQSR